MKKILSIFSLILLVGCSSKSSSDSSQELVLELVPGMTKPHVIEIMGLPEHMYNIKTLSDVWYYRGEPKVYLYFDSDGKYVRWSTGAISTIGLNSAMPLIPQGDVKKQEEAILNPDGKTPAPNANNAIEEAAAPSSATASTPAVSAASNASPASSVSTTPSVESLPLPSSQLAPAAPAAK